jgi:alpha-L-fucosidase 2
MSSAQPARETLLWYEAPAREWLEALALGNGSLGAMVWGGTQRERVDLNLDTFWSGHPRRHRARPPAGLLEAIREAVLERRAYHEADELAKGLQGPFNEAYQPLGWLSIELADVAVAGNYTRNLDLGEGIAHCEYDLEGTTRRREAFVSAPDNLFAMRLTSGDGAALDLRLTLGSPHPTASTSAEDGWVWMEGRAPEHVVPHYWPGEPAVAYSEGTGMRFAVAVAVIAEGGTLETCPSGWLCVQGASAVTALVSAACGYVHYDAPLLEDAASLRRTCRDRLEAVLTAPYGDLRDRHVSDHRRLFDRCVLELGTSPPPPVPTDERLRRHRSGQADDGLCALLLHYGRYLLMASSRPGGEASNLQGIWNDQVRPPWSCNWTANVNVEMNYWPAEGANLAECHEPLLELISDLADAGRATAADLYGCSGWCAHHNVDVWRSTWATGEGTAHPYWVNWQMGAAWLCQHLWDHYSFSPDRQYLERVYPVMKGAAEFLLQHLVRDASGSLVTCPSTSPENSFLCADGEPACVSAGSTLDMWLSRQLFAHCMAAAETLGRDAGLRAAWGAAMRQLRAPQAGAGGRLQEWWEDFGEPEPGHRHLSHLYGLFPGSEISVLRTPELAAAARASLEHRLANGGGSEGWSRAWVASLWARLRDGHAALQHLRRLLDCSVADNLFCSPEPGLFQVDGNLGAAAAIVEMLVQSHELELDLLPALPPEWQDGSVRGLRARGGLTVDIAWEGGTVLRATIDIPTSRALTLRCANAVRLRLESGPAGATGRLTPGSRQDLVRLEAPGPGLYVLARGR